MLNLPPLEALLAFHGLLTDPIIAALSKAAQSGKAAPSLSAQLVEKAETLGLWGRLPATYLVHLLGGASLPLSRFLEKGQQTGPSLKKALQHDLSILWPYLFLDPCDLSLSPLLAHYEPTIHHARKGEIALLQALLSAKDPDEGATIVLSHYESYGSGLFSEFDAFRLDEDGLLVGISDFPHYDDRDLLGYEAQKTALLDNTAVFAAGKKGNNVLLTGPGERENPPWSKPWFPALEKKVCALSKWSEPNWTTCPVFYPSSAKKSTIVLCFFWMTYPLTRENRNTRSSNQPLTAASRPSRKTSCFM